MKAHSSVRLKISHIAPAWARLALAICLMLESSHALALAPESVFSRRDSMEERQKLSAKDVEGAYDLMVRFFSNATTQERVAELKQTLMEKTVFSETPLHSPVGISRAHILFFTGLVGSFLASFDLYPGASRTTSWLLAGLCGGFLLGPALSNMISPHLLSGLLTWEDFLHFRWRKILAILAVKDPDSIRTAAVTNSIRHKNGTRELIRIQYHVEDPDVISSARHEAVHALNVLGVLPITVPENEYVLARAVGALDNLDSLVNAVAEPIATEKLRMKINNNFRFTFEPDALERLRAEIVDLMDLTHVMKAGSGANTFHQIRERFSQFSSTFRSHERMMKKQGATMNTEHLLPMIVKAYVWAAVAKSVSLHEDGGKLTAYLLLKELSASAPDPDDAKFQELVLRSIALAKAILERERLKIGHLPPAQREQILRLLRDARIGEAAAVFSGRPLGQASADLSAPSPKQDIVPLTPSNFLNVHAGHVSVNDRVYEILISPFVFWDSDRKEMISNARVKIVKESRTGKVRVLKHTSVREANILGRLDFLYIIRTNMLIEDAEEYCILDMPYVGDPRYAGRKDDPHEFFNYLKIKSQKEQVTAWRKILATFQYLHQEKKIVYWDTFGRHFRFDMDGNPILVDFEQAGSIFNDLEWIKPLTKSWKAVDEVVALLAALREFFPDLQLVPWEKSAEYRMKPDSLQNYPAQAERLREADEDPEKIIGYFIEDVEAYFKTLQQIGFSTGMGTKDFESHRQSGEMVSSAL